MNTVMLATEKEDLGLVPAATAAARAKRHATETGKPVSIRNAVTDKLLRTVKPAHARGDLFTGFLILATLAGLDALRVALALPGMGLGLIVYLSAAVTFASLAFWIAGARSFARDLTDFLILLSSYPGSIYAGATKLIAYTVLPAGFVVLTPVQLLHEPSFAHLAIAAASAIAYASIAAATFEIGLRRYQRGEAPVSSV